MNELLVMLKYGKCEAVAYKDDKVLTISGRFVHTIKERMQLAQNTIREWGTE